MEMNKNDAVLALINGIDDPNREMGDAANKIRVLVDHLMSTYEFDSRDFDETKAMYVACSHETIFWILSMILDYSMMIDEKSMIVDRLLTTADMDSRKKVGQLTEEGRDPVSIE